MLSDSDRIKLLDMVMMMLDSPQVIILGVDEDVVRIIDNVEFDNDMVYAIQCLKDLRTKRVNDVNSET